MLRETIDRSESICILICQNRTCRKQGSPQVLAALEAIATAKFSCQGCGCLGKCGNGPMVLVLPAQIWYDRVRPQDVEAIVRDLPIDF